MKPQYSQLQPPSQLKPPSQPMSSIPPSTQLKQPNKLQQNLNQGIQNMLQKKAQATTSGGAFQIGELPSRQPRASQQVMPQMSLVLQRVIGSTSKSEADIAFIGKNLVCYCALSYLVFYNFLTHRQVLLLQNINPQKAYKALCFENGRLYASESNTKQGEIHVYAVSQGDQELDVQLKEVLRGHKYGITQLAVQGDLLVSTGDENDKGMLVWDTKTPHLLSANLMKKSILSGAVFLPRSAADKTQFVTYGTKKHLKVWTINIESDAVMTAYSLSQSKPGEGVIPKLVGNKLPLKGIEDNAVISQVIVEDSFCYILSYTQGKASLDHRSYSVIRYNYVSQIITHTIKQPVSSSEQKLLCFPQSLSSHLIISGSFKRLQAIDKANFKFVGSADLSWANPPKRGQLQMITQEIYDYMAQSGEGQSEYAAITGLAASREGVMLQILSDGMILFHEVQSSKLIRVLMQHNDSVNDVILKQRGESSVSFMTCGKDSTLRLWQSDFNEGGCSRPIDGDLKRIVYLEHEEQLGKSSVLGRNPTLSESGQGASCMAYSQEKSLLAVGDMVGNIRVYRLNLHSQQQITQINFIEAHEGKITCLAFSDTLPGSIGQRPSCFLVSSSADRVIHIFNALDEDFELLQIIDVHQTSVVALHLLLCTVGVKNQHKVTQYEKQLRIYSCSSDKMLACHRYSPQERKFVMQGQKEQSKNKIYSMANTEACLVLAKDQGNIEYRQIESGKQTIAFQQNSSHIAGKALLDYTLASVSKDQQYLVLHDKEKTLQIRDIKAPQLLLTKTQLSDNLSGLALTEDNRYLICSSLNSKDFGGGLIYIFKIETDQAKLESLQATITLRQRNQDRAVIVDDLNSVITPKPPSQLQQESQLKDTDTIRKFQVKEELFNTWAQSTEPQKQTPTPSLKEESKQGGAVRNDIVNSEFIKDDTATLQMTATTFNNRSVVTIEEQTPGDSTFARSSLTQRYLEQQKGDPQVPNDFDDEPQQKPAEDKVFSQQLTQLEDIVSQMNLQEGLTDKERIVVSGRLAKLIGKLSKVQLQILESD